MSKVMVEDKKGGVFEVQVHFTYSECDQLPYNALRRMRASLDELPRGGVKASARFNLTTPQEAQDFIETLRLFCEGGLFEQGATGSPATAETRRLPNETPAASADSAMVEDDDDVVIEEEEEVID